MGMNRIGKDILIVVVCILALILAWEIFKFMFWIILWAVIIVLGYRLLKWLYVSVFGKRNYPDNRDY